MRVDSDDAVACSHQGDGHLDREELLFWQRQSRCGDDADLKMARDLPDDAPDYIIKQMNEFEERASDFCFSGASGLLLDAGCGNGNLLLRALNGERRSEGSGPDGRALRIIGMDFSENMLSRAAQRAAGDPRTGFLQGSVTGLPFADRSFDGLVSSGVLTCLPTPDAAKAALSEFHRVTKPGGVLVTDFFNRRSHYTLIRAHLLGESIRAPEYLTPSEFFGHLNDAGFDVISCLGFDFKPCQGYLFESRWRGILDPCHIQERLSRFLEREIGPGMGLNLLGYRIYVKCIRR